MLVITIVTSVLSIVLIFGMYFFLRKKAGGSQDFANATSLIAQIGDLDKEILGSIDKAKELASKGQLTKAQKEVEEGRTALDTEKEALKGIEQKLDGAQQKVEEKEAYQQEIKSSKAEDETRLAEMLANYEDISNESVALEQKLAASLKNLDSIMESVGTTDEQKSVLQDLSNALTTAGSRLRDLIFEYQVVNERLRTLSTQHAELEEEYTKLVEQQLGD